MIEQDHQRFRQIIKGKIRHDLRRFLTRGELLGREGKNLISIPIHGVEIPHFRYGENQPRIGAGEGEEGQSVGPPPSEETSGAQGGQSPGQHLMEVDVTLAELADILGEELHLPRILPRGRKQISAVRDKYCGIRRVGPESLRHFKRTYREALKRQIMMGLYDPANPTVTPVKNDKRFRSWKEVLSPQSNAVIIYMMDVSGSMGEEQKELVRIEAFWIDTWLRRNYRGLESRYIVHDVTAREVDKPTFYHLREDGGTKISSAFKCARALIDEHYDPQEWNIYLFHFSDGDNCSEADSRECCQMLSEILLPAVNLLGYCQVASAYGSGNFINVLHDQLPRRENLVSNRVNCRDDIYDSIKSFFLKGC